MRPHAAASVVLLGLMVACTATPVAVHHQEAAQTKVIHSTPSPSPSPAPASTPRPVKLHFVGTISSLPAALAARMHGTTWRSGCPVPLSDLRLLRLSYWDMDGNYRRGQLVINESQAAGMVTVFHKMFAARFAIAKLHLAVEYNPKNDDPHDARSWTTGFNCRVAVTARGPRTSWSQHAYGLAIDVNTVQNPYVTSDGYIHNIPSRAYRDRSMHLPGMIHAGDVVVRAFEAIGWHWGGYWSNDKDYMHFSLTGG